MRILIADDSPVSRHILEVTLRNWGYETITACDGTEAWTILESSDSPSLAILDWMMPGLTGPEVCRRVRQKPGDSYTYLLLLTSRSLKEDVVEGMGSGADDYITKPFDQHELKVRIRAGTRIIELQQQLLATQEALRQQATHDALTDLWNRSSVMEILDRELKRSEREGSEIGLLMVDLDHFKAVNDTYGHHAGDLALQESARRMQACIRSYDAIGRYGGEEFLVILVGCDEDGTQHQAERMRQAVQRDPLVFPEREIRISASFGCTTFVPGHKIAADALLRLADHALYRAKRRGRNRVEFNSCLMPQAASV